MVLVLFYFYIGVIMKTISSLNSMDSAKLVYLLRQIGKKFYLGKTSVLHMTSEEFMSDTWSDRTMIDFHGLTIQLESWTWDGKDYSDLRFYYQDVEFYPLQWEELVPYARVILWYLSESTFRDIYHLPLFKDEIAQTLELKDEVRKFEKNHKRVNKELFNFLTK